jgi:hypothetical protein
VQLYFQRCLLGLEQDRKTGSASDNDHVEVQIGKDGADEWEWRKAYRVWQAARKVYLYPENYLEPDLRDDKTPLFHELEAALLQKQIDAQSVLDAYTSYMDSFEEVGNLTVAGAYYDETKDRDTLHLVGVTASDPPTYYYRAIENPYLGKDTGRRIYHPWRKINVQIPVRRASPVLYLDRLLVFWVEIRTEPVTRVENAGSLFVGYKHHLRLQYTSLRLDGTWTPAQEIELPKGEHSPSLVGDLFAFKKMHDADGVVIEGRYAVDHNKLSRLGQKWTRDPVDDYTLSGPSWDTVYPQPTSTGLILVLRNFALMLDVHLFRRKASLHQRSGDRVRAKHRKDRVLLTAMKYHSTTRLYFARLAHTYSTWNAFANLILEEDRIDSFAREFDDIRLIRKPGIYAEKRKLAELPTTSDLHLEAIPGSISNVLLQSGSDLLLVHRQRHGRSPYRLQRLGTTLATPLARRLFRRGVRSLLDLDSQSSYREADPPITSERHLLDATHKGLDFNGPYGVYYRELFLHIPALIANHLNSQGDFAGAQRWYHRLFDPRADGNGSDRAWRYLEFRNQTWPTLRRILRDTEAIETAQDDPFNPHAIARTRLSAYSKNIVMKYIDNLLDWGDSLFRDFTMESVNEATLLYAMAADILGERPYQAADCGQVGEGLSYAQILPALRGDRGFLYELETHAAGKTERAKLRRDAEPARFAVDPQAITEVRAAVPLTSADEDDDDDVANARGTAGDDDNNDPTERASAKTGGPAWKHTAASGWSARTPAAAVGPGALSRIRDWPDPATVSPADFGGSLFRQIGPVFCVPPNEQLVGYWDRVEDRLYKIHHCLDIHGRRRDLALFSSALDPRLLVKMRAAGLSLDDLTQATSGDLPPYRFLYLIEKAKSFASTLQSFGSTLLSALEKKDAEELARLRLTHEQNLLSLNTQIKQWEIDAAEEGIETATKQKETTEFRRDHYQQLADTGLSAWEITQQVGRHIQTAIQAGVPPINLIRAFTGLVPQVGSPFAMKWGGVELCNSLEGFSFNLESIAKIAENIAASAGLEASFDRRREDWEFQRDVAQREVDQLQRQIRAAEIRRDIAKKSLVVHEQSIRQSEDIHEKYADKFTNFGLYTWLASNLQRTYRHAYTNALALARLCQAAFEFERDEEPRIALGANSWNGAHAGLLAGESLVLELQALERRFIETNYRTLEIEQSFPLTQIDPAALLRLRQFGECEFTIPEVFFDLAYPGHYRRRIKAARLTLPCVTGPYTNVGATLTLTASSVRRKPNPDTELVPVPLKRTVSIATSKAQNDAGVFELSFHDERYMPFEGAGAISTWKLELPRTFRPFDYATISDVVLTLHYTALADDHLRKTIEAENTDRENGILQYLAKTSITRIFSLRQEFPLTFRQLMTNPLGTPASFEIKDWHFPAFATAAGRRLVPTSAKLALAVNVGGIPAGAALALDGETVSAFTTDADLGGLPASLVKGSFVAAVRAEHAVSITALAGLRPDAIEDVLLCVAYQVLNSN